MGLFWQPGSFLSSGRIPAKWQNFFPYNPVVPAGQDYFCYNKFEGATIQIYRKCKIRIGIYHNKEEINADWERRHVKYHTKGKKVSTKLWKRKKNI